MANALLSPSDRKLVLPEFVRPITAEQALWQRWRHNLVGWASVPMRCLGRCAPRNSFGILMYHRVCPTPRQRFRPTYHVTPDRFEQQLSWLIGRGYQAMPLSHLLDLRQAGCDIPPKAFAVTFDDGFANNLTYALPILRRLNIPATIFLATAYIDSEQPFPFDNWMIEARSIGSYTDAWRPLKLAECEELLASELIELGCHTHTHADFRGKPGQLADDLGASLEFLRQRLSVERPLFSYPFGAPQLGFADECLAQVVRQAGCRCGLQIGNSLVSSSTDLYHLSRFDVPSGGTGLSLAGKLDGWSEGLRGLWRTLWNSDS